MTDNSTLRAANLPPKPYHPRDYYDYCHECNETVWFRLEDFGVDGTQQTCLRCGHSDWRTRRGQIVPALANMAPPPWWRPA